MTDTTTPTCPAPMAPRMASGESLPTTINRIERAINEASQPSEIKQVIALANAAVAYASTHYKEQRDMIQRAKAVKLLAERRLGEMLKAAPKNKGMVGSVVTGSAREPVKDSTPTLADLGIDKKVASRAQQLAALPDDEFAAVAAGAVPLARALAKKTAPKRRAPRRTKVADKRRQAVAEAQARHVSMFAVYAQMTIKELRTDHNNWSEEEIRLAAELAGLCAQIVRRVQALPA